MGKTDTVPQTVTRQPRQFKKSNADIKKLSPGDKIEGFYRGQTTAPWLDKVTGEMKDLTRLHFETDKLEKFIIFQDGGLKNAMANAMVKEGDYIMVEKLETTPLGGGREVNNYNIYHARD